MKKISKRAEAIRLFLRHRLNNADFWRSVLVSLFLCNISRSPYSVSLSQLLRLPISANWKREFLFKKQFVLYTSVFAASPLSNACLETNKMQLADAATQKGDGSRADTCEQEEKPFE